MIEIAGTARFVSDLHLRAERPDLSGRFLVFLEETAACRCEALFILGDLFEYWIGDDDLDDAFNRTIASALHRLRSSGTRIFFLAGNRDFLIGTRFAEAAGTELLEEATIVGIGGTATLLLHGDTLCTDDLPYQDFRRMVRGREWQDSFLARPLAERRTEVARLRQRSAEAMQAKAAAIMDVNECAVAAAFSACGCRRMIHGHTHRPGMHRTRAGCERWVLSDWEDRRGDAVEIDAGGVRRLDWSA